MIVDRKKDADTCFSSFNSQHTQQERNRDNSKVTVLMFKVPHSNSLQFHFH